MTDEFKTQGSSDWLNHYGLDLEDKVDCEVEGCDESALYYVNHRCCWYAFIACEGHMHSLLHRLRTLGNRGMVVMCTNCGQSVDPFLLSTRPQVL